MEYKFHELKSPKESCEYEVGQVFMVVSVDRQLGVVGLANYFDFFPNVTMRKDGEIKIDGRLKKEKED